jgi:hypothetical protein
MLANFSVKATKARLRPTPMRTAGTAYRESSVFGSSRGKSIRSTDRGPRPARKKNTAKPR